MSAERSAALRRAREALDELKSVSLPSSECGVHEAEQRAASARRAVAVVGRLERHQSCSTSGGGDGAGGGGGGGGGGKEEDLPAASGNAYESLREELRREGVKAVGAAVERERSLLFEAPPSSAVTGDAATRDAESTAADVTAGLRRARGVLMAEVDRTDAAMGVMDDSIKSLGAINGEFEGSMKSGLNDSRGLLRKLERQEQMEKYVMWITFAVFMLVVCFVCYRRLPFLQVHRLIQLGTSAASKAGSIISGGGGADQTSSSSAHVVADGIAGDAMSDAITDAMSDAAFNHGAVLAPEDELGEGLEMGNGEL